MIEDLIFDEKNSILKGLTTTTGINFNANINLYKFIKTN
jgi:hypothetical protein